MTCAPRSGGAPPGAAAATAMTALPALARRRAERVGSSPVPLSARMAARRSALGPVDRRGRPAERHCLSGNCRPAPAGRPLRKHAAAARLCAVRVVAVRDRRTGRRHDHRACRGARLARPGCRAERGLIAGESLSPSVFSACWRACSGSASSPISCPSDPDRLHQRHLDLHPGRPDRARYRRQARERRAGRPAL